MSASSDFHGKWFQKNHGICDIRNGDNPPPAVAEFMTNSNIAKPAGSPVVNLAIASPIATKIATIAKDDGGDLDLGDSGPRVTKLQEELAVRGFYKGVADGQFGTKTEDAVTAYKVSKNFGPGAKAGKRVLDDLGIGL